MPKVFLISGWATRGSIWDPLSGVLSAEFELERVEWWQGLKGELTERLQALEEPAFIVGWSMGGQLALEASFRHPRKTAGVIAISSMSCLVRKEDRPGVDPLQVETMRSALVSNREVCLRSFFRNCLRPELSSSEAGRLIREMDGVDTAQLLRGLDFMSSVIALPAESVPVLAIHGSMDAIVPWHCSTHLCGTHPERRSLIIEGAGHMLPLSQYTALGKECIEFMQNHSA